MGSMHIKIRFPFLVIAAAALMIAACQFFVDNRLPAVKKKPHSPVKPLCTVTFNTRSIGTAIVPLQVAQGGRVESSSLPELSHATWDFAGWFKDACTTIPFNSASEAIVSDMTLYAKWTPKLIHARDLWKSKETRGVSNYFRIPALAESSDGSLIAVTDLRYNHSADIGKFGENGEWGLSTAIHRVDLTVKHSGDFGLTWDSGHDITAAPDNPVQYGYGDAAIVADRDSAQVLILSAHGDTRFGHYVVGDSSTRLKVVKLCSSDGGASFTQPTEITDDIYRLNSNWGTLFFGSGKIMQSRRIKRGAYYRIYAAILAKKSTSNGLFGNAVLYSDDFGQTWQILGDVDTSPIPNGDEAKIEELPDGRVLLSSRTANGRLFNIFTYTDEGTGTGRWEQPQKAALGNERGTNGEILIIQARKSSTKEPAYLALQSIPFSSKQHPKGGHEPNIRTDVGIYWRPVESGISLSELVNQSKWKKYQVFTGESSYSTMVMQRDHRIGFLYEKYDRETTAHDMNDVYDIRYENIPVSTITAGEYEAAFLSE